MIQIFIFKLIIVVSFSFFVILSNKSVVSVCPIRYIILRVLLNIITFIIYDELWVAIYCLI